MKFQIKDFCDLHAIEVEPLGSGDEKLVLLIQRGASMYFQHTMRPEQARFLASALQMAADEAEGVQAPAQVDPAAADFAMRNWGALNTRERMSVGSDCARWIDSEGRVTAYLRDGCLVAPVGTVAPATKINVQGGDK